MNTVLYDQVRRNFAWLSAIPRASKDTARVSAALAAWARERNLRTWSDTYGNLVIFKPASAGRETECPLALQAHLDMVAQKLPESSHDFSHDGIELHEEDGWLSAVGTTLGADDGAGVAICMAVLENNELSHPALEIILTVDEEIGLVGAKKMDCSAISARRMLNLDLTVPDVFVVGCCAGTDITCELPLSAQEATCAHAELTLAGLLGGHSGIDIALGHKNSALLMAELLTTLNSQLISRTEGAIELGLVSFHAGEKENAIPANARAEVALLARRTPAPAPSTVDTPHDLQKLFLEIVGELAASLSSAAPLEPGATLATNWLGTITTQVADARATQNAIAFLTALPQGVLRMSDDFPGAIETSDNVSMVSMDTPSQLQVLISIRTNVKGGEKPLVDAVDLAARHAGCTFKLTGGYEPWQADVSSSFLLEAQAVYRALFGVPVALTTTHGGLECGVFSDKLPRLEVFSVGPRIEGAHTPHERMELDTFERLCAFVEALLKR
ncbi:MAG: beta-Ala-His dipeptidase [Atopobiaceae bacterium]|jgi:dipeptidase D